MSSSNGPQPPLPSWPAGPPDDWSDPYRAPGADKDFPACGTAVRRLDDETILDGLDEAQAAVLQDGLDAAAMGACWGWPARRRDCL